MAMMAQPVAESFFESFAPIVVAAGAAVVGVVGYLAGCYIQSLHHEIKSLNQELMQKKAEHLELSKNYQDFVKQVVQLETELEKFKTPLIQAATVLQNQSETEKEATQSTPLYKALEAILGLMK